MKDDRDEPNIELDINGNKFYITKYGDRIPMKTTDSGETLKELEEKLEWRMRYPLGMK